MGQLGSSCGLSTDHGNTAGELANDIMSQAVEIASKNAALATAASNDAANSLPDISEVTWPRFPAPDTLSLIETSDYIDNVIRIFDRESFDREDLIEIDVDTANAADTVDIPEPDTVNISDFTGEAPILIIPELPVFTFPVDPVKPDISIGNPPASPVYQMPTKPVLVDVTVPDAITPSLPIFEATLDYDDVLAPSNDYDFVNEEYVSALQDAAVASLLNDILTGGYGLDPNDEAALWQRSRDKEAEASMQMEEEIVARFAEGGFPMPPGAMFNALEKAGQEFHDKISGHNREQTLERSNKYWEGKKFTLTEAREFESILMNYHSARLERALNWTKAQAQIAVDFFNAEVAAYNLKLERYKTEAEVYATLVQGELSKVELYKAQIDAARLLSEFNKTHIDLYSAELSAVSIMLDNYKTDVDAYRVLTEVERLKMEIFRAETEAYVAGVRGKEAEFNAYEAAVKGQEARTRAYQSEAEAYRAVVEGKKAQIESDKVYIEALATKNQAEIARFQADVEQLNSIRNAKIAYNQNIINFQDSKTALASAEIQGYSSAYTLEERRLADERADALAELEASTQAANYEAQRVIEAARMHVEQIRAAGEVNKALAASAMSAINCNASLADTVSNSNSNSVSCSTNYNDSKAITEGIQTVTSYSTALSTSTNTNKNTSYSKQESDTKSTNFSESFADDEATITNINVAVQG